MAWLTWGVEKVSRPELFRLRGGAWCLPTRLLQLVPIALVTPCVKSVFLALANAGARQIESPLFPDELLRTVQRTVWKIF